MEYQNQLYSDWRSSAAKVFWGIVLASVFSVFCNFYDMVSWIGSLMEMTYEHSQTGETSVYHSKFFWIGVGGKMLIIIGYVLYLVGLTQFAQIQQKESTAHYVYKARTSVILLIVTCIISIVFWFVKFIPLIGIIFAFIIWLMYVITYFIMKHAYDGMMMADDFGGRAKLGAKNVRYAAVCQLRLLFMPLVILLVALLYMLMVGASIYGMREELAKMAFQNSNTLEGGAMIIILPAIILGIVAIVCAIIWAICAFIWPMMGWYRIMSDGPADVMIVVRQEQSNDESVTNEKYPLSEADDSKLEPEASISSDILSREKNEAEDNSNKKWYYIGGGVLAALLIGILSVFLFKGCNTSDNLLNVQKPSWEKFIMVTSDNVTLFKEPSATSSKLMWAMENVESDMCDFQFRWEDQGKKRGYTVSDYTPEEKTVMPVLEDVGEWYKVHVQSAMAGVTEAYINKKWCKEVTPQPITEDVLERVDKASYRCDYVIKNGNMKGLCFSTLYQELEGEYFEMGQLIDGVLFFPETESVYINHDISSGMTFKKNEEFAGGYILSYSDDRSFKSDNSPSVFDTRSLTEEEVEDIYKSIKVDAPKSFEVLYYFPEADQDRLISFTYSLTANSTSTTTAEDQPEEGVKNYVVSEATDDNPQQELMTELDEEIVSTGISETYITLIEEFDDDDDGYHEALISETCGGSGCPEKISFVYYDKDSKTFKQTEFFSYYSQPIKEDWEGKPSYVQRYGLHLDRYVFENHQLRKVEDKTKDVGASLRRWTRESLFDKDTDEEKTVHFDMDGDGTEETLTISHFTSHLYEWGESMSLDKITWDNGRESDCPGLYTGKSLTILESMTNGLHDILIGDAYLYRWNGEKFEEWIWDGDKLVKSE